MLGFDPQRQRGELNRRVGIVLQRSTPMEGLTPREMLNFTAKLYDDPMDPNEALELVGLTEHADRRGSKLSGGQKRRLDLATSVIGNPDLIFLDEPTTGFDVAARRQAWSVVRGLTERGATVLLTTHYLDEAENLAQRIGMIKDGRLIFEGMWGSCGGRCRPIRGSRGCRRRGWRPMICLRPGRQHCRRGGAGSMGGCRCRRRRRRGTWAS